MSTAITTPTPTINSSLDPNDEYYAKSPSLETPRRSSENAADHAGSTTTSVNTPTPSVNSNADSNDEGPGGTAKVSIVSDDTATSGNTVGDNKAMKSEQDSSSKKAVKYSSMKSRENPLTILRQKRIEEGVPLMVQFDERVVVHTVPYWDPCGETFYDTDDHDGPRGPNCCAVL